MISKDEKHHIDEANRYRELAYNYGFKAPDEFWSAPIQEVAKSWNGIGKDSWPQFSRDILDKLLPHVVAASVVHDWCYDHSDGTKESYNKANSDFYYNVKQNIKYDFPLLNPFNWIKRKILMDLACLAYYAVQEEGWDAYQAAYEKLKAAKLIPMKPKIV